MHELFWMCHIDLTNIDIASMNDVNTTKHEKIIREDSQ